jgi:hypothetical protein
MLNRRTTSKTFVMGQSSHSFGVTLSRSDKDFEQSHARFYDGRHAGTGRTPQQCRSLEGGGHARAADTLYHITWTNTI